MRVAILRRAPKASFSMDVYADRLVSGLKTVRPHWEIVETHPQFQASGSSPAKGLAGIQKYYERYWCYPWRLEQLDADIFHVIDHSDGDLCRWLRRSHLPTVVTCHDLINLIKPETFKGRAQFPLISMSAWRWGVKGMRAADHVVTVSSHTKQDVIEHLQIAAAKITAIPNAVDEGFYQLPAARIQAIREQYGLSPEQFCLLNVGSNNARKNISTILSVVAMLKRKELPVHFWKAGVDFTLDQNEFIQAQDLTSCVTYLGQPDSSTLVQLYNAADCLMAPSLYEGFGLTILEAMACGTPVITANVSAMPEVAGDAAVLVDPTNKAAIVESLQQLYTCPEKRQHFSKKGLERVKRFTWENTAEQVAQVYEQVLSHFGTELASSFRSPSMHPHPSTSTPIDSLR